MYYVSIPMYYGISFLSLGRMVNKKNILHCVGGSIKTVLHYAGRSRKTVLPYEKIVILRDEIEIGQGIL